MSGKSHKRVLFLGGESSGKSTITKAVSARLNCFYAPEYGREFYENRPDQDPKFLDMETIAKEQVLIEISILELSTKSSKEFSFYDTSALVTYFYSMEWFNKAPDLLRLQTLGITRTYDYIFLCKNDFPFVQDGQRHDLKFAIKQHDFYQYVLDTCQLPYVSLSGTVEQRLNTVLKTIGVIDEKV